MADPMKRKCGRAARYAPLVTRLLAVLLSAMVARSAATVPRIEVLEGDGAINNIGLHRAKDPVVRVVDQDGHPLANVAVTFVLPGQGASGTFANGQTSMTVMTDATGQAVGRGLRPNSSAGQFQIRVTTSLEGQLATANVMQINAEPARGRGSYKTILIVALIGGAAAAGAALALKGKSRPPPRPRSLRPRVSLSLRVARLLVGTNMRHPIIRCMVLGVLAAGAVWGISTNCTSLPAVAGATVNVTCTPTGTGPFTWTISAGALPPSLTQDPNSGSITETMPATAYDFTVMVTDSPGATASQTYQGQALSVSCSSGAGPVEVNLPYTNQCTAAGGTPPYAWSITGEIIPAGLSTASITQGNPATVNYTPGPGSQTPAYDYFVLATDSSQNKKGQEFIGAIVPAVTITTTSPLPSAAVGSLYSVQFMLTGGVSPYTWSATPGDKLSMSATGLLSGTPTTPGPLSFPVAVMDGNGAMSSGTFALTVTSGLTITNTSPLPPATVNSPYTQTFTATGGSGTGYTWSATGLPLWLTLNPTSGLLSGTPPLPPASSVTSTFTVNVTDSNNNSASGPFTLPVTLAITTTSPLPAATVGTSYTQTLSAGGGTGGYTWAVTTGSLPSGLTLSTAGVISGTPLAGAKTASFTVTVTDSSNASLAAPFTLPITLGHHHDIAPADGHHRDALPPDYSHGDRWRGSSLHMVHKLWIAPGRD